MFLLSHLALRGKELLPRVSPLKWLLLTCGLTMNTRESLVWGGGKGRKEQVRHFEVGSGASQAERNLPPTQDRSRGGVLEVLARTTQDRPSNPGGGSWPSSGLELRSRVTEQGEGAGESAGGGRENREQFPSGALAPFSHPPHPNRIRNRAQLTDKAETNQILQVQAGGSRPDRGRFKCAQDFHTGRPWVVADPEADGTVSGISLKSLQWGRI